MSAAWVDAVAVDLDPVVRARAMAAALPGAGVQEAVFDVPYDEAWPRIMDLERSVPAADPLVGSLAIHDRRVGDDGVEVVHFVTRGISSLYLPHRFTARIEDGYCLMRSDRRLFVVVMAARPEGERTRYLHCEAVPRRAGVVLRRLMQHDVRIDVEGFERFVRAGSG